jgi:hypothetical protein
MSLHNVKFALVTSALLLAGLAHGQDAQTSSTKTAPSGELKNWSLKYLNYTNGPTFEASTGPSVNHFIDLSRNIGEWNVAAVGRFDTTAKPEENSKTVPADHYLKINTPKLGSEKTKVFGSVRNHIPTSDASQRAGQTFAFEPRLYIENTSLKNLAITSSFRPKFHSYDESKADQVLSSYQNVFEFVYTLNSTFSIDVATGPGYTVKREQERLVGNNTPTDVGGTINFTPNFAVTPYIEFQANRPKYKTSYFAAVVSYKAF